MHPIAFHLAGYPVRSQGLLYVLAVIVAGVCADRIARRRGWNTELVLPGLALVVAAAYLGARLHGALNAWHLVGSGPIRGALTAELSFFGGLALGSAALVAYLWRARLPVAEVTDSLAPLAPIVYAMFRLGCFLNGDDYGSQTSLPWGMSFPEGSPPMDVPVHPSQLYELLLMAPVFLWIRARSRADLPAGAVAFELCILMGTERFLVEYSRSTSGLSSSSYLMTAQWFAFVLAVIGIGGRMWRSRLGAHGKAG